MTSADETTPHDQYLLHKTKRIQKILSLLVGQLRNGCGSTQCRQILCHTGRSNTSKRPTRRYTIQAARVIAFDVYSSSSQDLGSILCQYYVASTEDDSEAQSIGPSHDVGSLPQSIATTHAFRRPDLTSAPDRTTKNVHSEGASHWHQKLDNLKGLELTQPQLGESITSNAALAAVLVPCLIWLVSRIPVPELEVIVGVHDRINGVGTARQTSDSEKPGPAREEQISAAWNAIGDEEFLGLFERVIGAVSKRSTLEAFVRTKLNLFNHNHHIGSGWSVDSFSDIEIELRTAFQENATWSATEAYTVRVWLEVLFFKYWDGSANLGQAPLCRCILSIISWDWTSLSWPSDLTPSRRRTIFQMPRLALELDEGKAARVWLSMSELERRKLHIFSHWTLFDGTQRLTYFRNVNILVMRKENAESVKVSRMRLKLGSASSNDIPEAVTNAESYFLLLNVSRNHILQDTFDQLWHRRRSELLRPLRVRLGEIDELDYATDMGGVQVEFFNLVFKEIMENSQMFVANEASGTYWARAGSLQPLHMYEMVGILIGMAMYNGITIPIDLPTFFYGDLLHERGDPLEACREIWPDVVAGLEKLTDDVLDGMDFIFPMEANGLRLDVSYKGRTRGELIDTLHVHSITPIGSLSAHSSASSETNLTVESLGLRNAWPGWKLVDAEDPPEPLTPENKQDFQTRYCHWLQFGAVQPQHYALKQGIRQVFNREDEALHVLAPSGTLKELVEGSRYLDIAALRAATKYERYEPEEEYINWFWDIVMAWPQEKQKKLLQFVTALEKIPFGGEKFVKFVIDERWYYDQEEGKENLPTASTCFGTLGLPRYPNKETLRAKLDMAIDYAHEGFGNG